MKEQKEAEVYADIGRRIRDARERSGMTQVDLARFLSVSGPELSRIEQGKRRVTIIELQTLSHVLGQHLIWFLTGEDPMAISQSRPQMRPIPDEALKEVNDFIAYIWQKYGNKTTSTNG